jgi:hypothetical protein
MISSSAVEILLKDSNFSLIENKSSQWKEYNFDILLSSEEYDPSIVVGKMKVYKLNVGEVLRKKVSMFDAFDCFLQETYDCYSVVFDEEDNIKKAFGDEYYDQMENLFNDFHLLSYLEIDERFKGNELTAIAVQIYLEYFANAEDVMYFKGFPLQFSDSKDLFYKRNFKGEFKECEKKLCSYYQKLGFRRIGKSPNFFFVVDNFLKKRMEINCDK